MGQFRELDEGLEVDAGELWLNQETKIDNFGYEITPEHWGKFVPHTPPVVEVTLGKDYRTQIRFNDIAQLDRLMGWFELVHREWKAKLDEWERDYSKAGK